MAQTVQEKTAMNAKLQAFFKKYKTEKPSAELPAKVKQVNYDKLHQEVDILVDDDFGQQEFTASTVNRIYGKVRKLLVKPFNKGTVRIKTCGLYIEDLIPDRLSSSTDKSRLWGDIEYKGKPWVSNESLPYRPTHGLQNRHLSLWASHGRYYDVKTNQWKWQRPALFGTNEDLFTQTIVVPFLIPMLENAGAVVFTPRERDWQRHEVIVDNDDARTGVQYIEVSMGKHWTTTQAKGFARHDGDYVDGENPFEAGTARQCLTTKSEKQYSLASYQPRIPVADRYAVYVSYTTTESSIDDAEYIVWHRGERTVFHVNQRMGGGTWVYLGTFDFDKGCDEFNRVVVTNHSSRRGTVTTDAVRFGGGMGNIRRGDCVSGLPRCLEGARYYAQWAGIPRNIYSTKNGSDDYGDDINTRSLTTNLLGGGSVYMPSKEGRQVPIELSLAVHSDAGYVTDSTGLIGSLAICTTHFNDGRLNAGISRLASRDLASQLLNNINKDLHFKYGEWNKRELYDRNYSETRLPEVPSAIIETMSHQNFNDMRYGHDPNFKFTLARSIYKTLLRYICDQHDRPYVVTPLAPKRFDVRLTGKGQALLSWEPVKDPQEASSAPTGYIVYTSVGDADFDNGTYVRNPSLKVKMEPDMLYSFKVVAVNRGGRSFPTPVLCALSSSNATETIMVINGFNRLSSPAVVNNALEQGFDLKNDPGVSWGRTAGWLGCQQNFDRLKAGIEGPDGLGWSDDSLAGRFIAGNTMDYVRTHAKAIQKAGAYNIVSSTSEAVERGESALQECHAADVVLGLEKDDGHSLEYYKSFSPRMRSELEAYTRRGGCLMVSGAYVASDLLQGQDQDRTFVEDVLKCQCEGSYRDIDNSLTGLGNGIRFQHELDELHYATTAPDVLRPLGTAFTAMTFADGTPAAIAYKGNDYRAMVCSVPFECILGPSCQASMMHSILNFLLK